MPRHGFLLVACAAVLIVGWIPASGARAVTALVCVAILALVHWQASRSQQLRRSLQEGTEAALRRSEQDLARASLAEITASIAHEINQPLAATVANGHACERWLSAQPPNVERAVLTVQRIVRDANAAANVVSRIRALFSKAELERCVLDLGLVIAEVCQLLGDELRGVQLLVERGDPEIPPLVRADRVKIQQVLVNLLRNGIDAMQAVTGRQRILVVRTGGDAKGDVLIEIADGGVGFASDVEIFEPFFTTKQSGMGMGLTICRSIITAHEGRLWATRNAEHGSTFHFTLPRAHASDSPEETRCADDRG